MEKPRVGEDTTGPGQPATGLAHLARMLRPLALYQDLKYAFRSLRRASAFTLVAATTLGLGIGQFCGVHGGERGDGQRTALP